MGYPLLLALPRLVDEAAAAAVMASMLLREEMELLERLGRPYGKMVLPRRD